MLFMFLRKDYLSFMNVIKYILKKSTERFGQRPSSAV